MHRVAEPFLRRDSKSIRSLSWGHIPDLGQTVGVNLRTPLGSSGDSVELGIDWFDCIVPSNMLVNSRQADGGIPAMGIQFEALASIGVGALVQRGMQGVDCKTWYCNLVCAITCQIPTGLGSTAALTSAFTVKTDYLICPRWLKR